MSYDKGFHSLVFEGKFKVMKGMGPAGISSDGRSVVFKDGRTLEADVTICATGFGHPLTFIRESFPNPSISRSPSC